MKCLFDAIHARFTAQGKLGLIDLYTVEAPEGCDWPYGTVSTNVVADWTFEETQEDCLIMFTLFSKTPGHTEICNCFELLKTAFDFHDLAVAGYEPISLERGPANLIKVEKVWQYSITYRLLIEKT